MYTFELSIATALRALLISDAASNEATLASIPRGRV